MLKGHLHILQTYSLTYCMGNKFNRGACIRNLNIEWFDDLAMI